MLSIFAQFFENFSDQQSTNIQIEPIQFKKLEPIDKCLSELLKDAKAKKDAKTGC